MRPADLQVYCLKTCPMLNNFEQIEREVEMRTCRTSHKKLCVIQAFPAQLGRPA